MSDAHHYQLAALLTFAVNIFLAVWVFRKATNRALPKRFVLYCASISTWSISVFICTTTSDYTVSYRFAQLTHLGATLIPVFFLDFVLRFLQLEKETFQNKLLKCCYGLQFSFIGVIVFLPQLFFSGLSPKLTFNQFPNPGPLYTPWMLLFFLIVTYAHGLIFRKLLTSGEERWKQLGFFFIGNLVGYSGGIGCFLPVYGISTFPFPYGAYGVVLFSVVTAYAVVKYGFLDIEAFLRKTVVFAGLVSFVFGMAAVVTFFLRDFLQSFLGLHQRLLTVMSVVVIVALFHQVEIVLVRLTDNYLFQKKYDYKELLKRFADDVMVMVDLKQLVQKTVNTLVDTVKLDSCSLLLLNKDKRTYELVASRGTNPSTRP
jgi:hypothetical protein